jgi:integrase
LFCISDSGLIAGEEITELGRVLHEVEQDGSETKAAVNAIRLLMLTGCRLNEIMTLKCDYGDLNGRELRLPDSKTGAKVVPFGKTAAAALKRIEKVDDNPYVITGKSPVAPLPTCRIRGGASGRRLARQRAYP